MLQSSSPPPTLTLQHAFYQIMVLTTNLVLDGEQLEHGAARFFSETSRAAEGQVGLRAVYWRKLFPPGVH